MPAHMEPDHLFSQVLAIPVKRTLKRLVILLMRPEMEALLDAPDRRKWTDRRDHTMLLVLYNTELVHGFR